MKYQITTLKDIFDKVPADRIKTCMDELAIAMQQAKAMSKPSSAPFHLSESHLMFVKYPSPRHIRRQMIKQSLLAILAVILFVSVIDIVAQKEAEAQQIDGCAR